MTIAPADEAAGPAERAPLRLCLIGQPMLRGHDGIEVTLAPKDAALLAKLALDGPQPRASLCELLWPAAVPEAAAASLRQRASRLYRIVGQQVIQLGKQVRLAPDVEVDVLASAELPDADLMNTGTLLAGIDLGDHDELDRWLGRARMQAAETRAQVLADRAEALAHAGRLHEALPMAQRAADLLPLSEHAARRVMRLHYLRGDRAAAQEAFWRLAAALRDELGIRASAETLQLMQTVERAERSEAVPHRPVPVSVLRPPLLIGRDEAWRSMSTAWQSHQGVLLVGEAGLGKSRLLEEFVRGREGVLADRAQPGDERTPYAVLGRVLVRIERQFPGELEPALRAELARLRPEFGSAPADPAHTQLMWRAVERLIAVALDAGLQALVIDDLHYADEASVAALRWLCASASLRELRLGLATRPWEDGCLWSGVVESWMVDSHRLRRIDLRPLTPPQLTEFLGSLSLPALVDAGLAAQLFRHAGGHPLFTLATLQDLLTRDLDGTPLPLPQPSSVQALLDARLRKLPGSVQDLLRVAAVAGADLTVDRAARMLGCPVLALSEAWSLLETSNVLNGEAFSHDLVHESAVRLVPRGVQQALHRQFAALLVTEGPSSPAQVAEHWELGGVWGEAGRWWMATAVAARAAGRLAEHIELSERAARCHGQDGDAASRFEALHARLDALLLCRGGAAVRAALPELEALADTAWQRVRCRLARAEALLDGEHSEAALAETRWAVHEAEAFPVLRADAGVMHAQALVQRGEFEPALSAASAALAAAVASGDEKVRLRVLNALCYVHYAAGQLADAVVWQREAVTLAESLGQRAEAAAGEGNLAALLASIGDVSGTYTHAVHVRDRHRALGLDDESTLGVVNYIVLGSAAAALGRFDEALPALQTAVAMAGDGAAVAARAKARLALASVWLTLGRLDAARSEVEAVPADVAAGFRMQALLLLARAAEWQGLPALRYTAELGSLADRHRDAPLVQSAWFEASFQGDPVAMVERLRSVRLAFLQLGLHGSSRSLAWRELVRRFDCEDPNARDAELALAEDLRPHVARGLSAKCYPPEVWLTLADAFRRTGREPERRACLLQAADWVAVAAGHVSEPYRDSFLRLNPVNRTVLAAAPRA